VPPVPREPGDRASAAPEFNPRRRRSPLAQRLGQRRGDDLAKRVMVIVGGPAQQLQQRRIEQAVRIDQRMHRLQGTQGDRGRIGVPHDYAYAVARAHGHTHARADGYLQALAPCGRQVIEQRVPRHVDRDPQQRSGCWFAGGVVHNQCG